MEEQADDGMDTGDCGSGGGGGTKIVVLAPAPAPAPAPARKPDCTSAAALAGQDDTSVEKPKKSSCGVMNCSNNSNNYPNMSFFRMPSNPARAAKWLKQISLIKSKAKKVLICEVHFEKRYINMNDTRKRLVANAVPTLHLANTEDLECTPDVDVVPGSSNQTDKRPLGIDFFENRIKRIKASEKVISNFTEAARHTPENSRIVLSELIKLQSKFRELSDREKYNDSDTIKFFALKLYYSHPKTYRLLQSMLNLPKISTLYRISIPSTTQLCEKLIIALKLKVDTMTEEQRQSAVCIGTMDLKAHLNYHVKKDQIIGFHDVDGVQRLEPAQTGLVVMVRGLFDNWRQAVGYCLLAKYQDYRDVRMYIYKIIMKMFDIGLNVRVFISDIESDFVGISKEKKINSRDHFFLLNGIKVFYMYDPPHLIKVIQDNFVNHDIVFQKKTAKWKHVVECYDHDCKQALRLAPKLTSYHIIHTHMQSEKDKVMLAAQVFSKTTAAAISTYADLKVLDGSAKETVEWLLTMNTLFDMLNFRSCTAEDEARRMFRGELHQFQYLNEMVLLFKGLRLVDTETGAEVSRNAKFIQRFIVTLKAIIALHKDLNRGTQSLPCIGLSRDCLDTFFHKVRQQYGRLPTCKEFSLSICKMPIFTVFQCSGKKNNKDNLDFFLMDAKNIDNIERYEMINPRIGDISFVDDLTGNIKLNAMSLPEENCLQYMAAYLLYEGYQQHSDCEAMKCYVFEHNESSSDNTVILTMKSENKTNNNTVVVMVPTDFVEFIESMELTLKLYFETEYQRHPVSSLQEHLLVDGVTCARPCACFPLRFIKQLYIRYRLHVLIKYNNKQFQNKKDCRKYFKVNQL